MKFRMYANCTVLVLGAVTLGAVLLVLRPEHDDSDALSNYLHYSDTSAETQTRKKAPTENGENDQFSPASRNVEDAVQSAVDGRKFESRYRSARNAAQAQEIIDSAAAHGYPFARDWQARLDGFCYDATGNIHSQVEDDLYEHQRAEYCQDYIPRTYFDDMDPLDLMGTYENLHSNQLRSELANELSELDQENTGEWLMNRATEVEFAEEIDVIMELAQERNIDLVNAENLPAALDSMRVQSTALQLYKCWSFGGCEPGSMAVIERCLIADFCAPGWGFEDLMRAYISPIEFDTAVRIARKLSHEHANR